MSNLISPLLSHWLTHDKGAQQLRNMLTEYEKIIQASVFLNRDVLRGLSGHAVALRLHERRQIHRPNGGGVCQGVRLDLVDLVGPARHDSVWITQWPYVTSLGEVGIGDWVIRMVEPGDRTVPVPDHLYGQYAQELARRLDGLALYVASSVRLALAVRRAAA
ncbi:hypothetical protein ACWCYZ_39580 [Streptomyces virginiae]